MSSSRSIFDLPFLFPDLATVERFQQSEIGQTLLTALTEQRMLGLTFWHNGMKQIGSPRPLRVPSDAAGLKFRIMESDVLQAQIEAIGGSPQKMAFGEVIRAALPWLMMLIAVLLLITYVPAISLSLPVWVGWPDAG